MEQTPRASLNCGRTLTRASLHRDAVGLWVKHKLCPPSALRTLHRVPTPPEELRGLVEQKDMARRELGAFMEEVAHVAELMTVLQSIKGTGIRSG